MIIVDLDKLHFPFTTARPEYAQGVQDLHKAILKCKIDAIPVKWIKKQALEHPQLNRNLFYQMIIEQWEKENDSE